MSLLPLPSSLHWLGDRERADATAHAQDVKGCVMFFNTQGECLDFMNFITNLAMAREAPTIKPTER